MNIALNGKSYPLRFTVNALCCLEEKTGQGLDQLQGGRISTLRGLLWCGLMEGCPAITLESAGQLLNDHLQHGGDLASVSDALAAALEDACFFPPRGRETPKAAP